MYDTNRLHLKAIIRLESIDNLGKGRIEQAHGIPISELEVDFSYLESQSEHRKYVAGKSSDSMFQSEL